MRAELAWVAIRPVFGSVRNVAAFGVHARHVKIAQDAVDVGLMLLDQAFDPVLPTGEG